jgi:predicted N-acetyltransferase YhbS
VSDHARQQADIEAIKASTEPADVLAGRYGIPSHVVDAIRRGDLSLDAFSFVASAINARL